MTLFLSEKPNRLQNAIFPNHPNRILIVDDNTELAENLRDVLIHELGPLEVTLANTGSHALSVATTLGFDVAIVDMKLPDGSGIDLLPALHQVAPFGEVIVITGFATLDAAMAALQGGAFALVLKSFRAEELKSVVEQALTKVALRRERDQFARRYRALVEVADVLVVALDRVGRLVLVNPKLCNLVQSTSEQVLGQTLCDEWIALEDRERFRNAMTSVFSSGQPHEIEVRLLASVVALDASARSSSTSRIIRWHFSAENDARHLADALIFGIGVDVTERRALERKAADAEALSTMATLALGLAHEIRNPLNAAVLQMHLLSRQLSREVKEEAIQNAMHDRVRIVVTEIKRLGRLLTEFLEFARPRGLIREPIVLEDVIAGVLELHQEEATQRTIHLQFNSSQSSQGKSLVLGDREKLRQIFVNLIVNSLDALPDRGTISISIHAHSKRWIVQISDTGSGIEEHEVARIFEPFFTTKPGGTGLGLSIVRKLVEQHEGAIQLHSVVGTGTTVTLEFPMYIH